MGLSAGGRSPADDGRMGIRALAGLRRRHGFLLLAVLGTVAGAAVAALVDLGARVCALFGLSPHTLANLLVPVAVAWGFLAWHSLREARQRRMYERNLIRTNLHLRQAASSLERLANIDALSGLYNRRAWHEKLEQEWVRALRYGNPPAVIMLDIDNFKLVNDRYGHQAGDDLLCAVAEALREDLRASDVIGRLGGDEFAVLLPEAGEEEAALVAEKMRAAIAGRSFAIYTEPLSMTISAGVATAARRLVRDPRDLLRLADRALYDAKAAGRNCVVVAREADAAPRFASA